MIDIKNKILWRNDEHIKYGVAAWHRYILKHIVVWNILKYIYIYICIYIYIYVRHLCYIYRAEYYKAHIHTPLICQRPDILSFWRYILCAMYLCTMVTFFHEWETIFSLHIRIIRIPISILKFRSIFMSNVCWFSLCNTFKRICASI